MRKVFIVEDEPVIAKVLKQNVEDEQTSIQLFSLGKELLKALSENNIPDIILMDINLPDTTGIELTKIIKEKYPNIEIIMQTVNEENNIIISSIEAGCSGYLLKTSTADEIRLAINIVQEGGSFLTGKIARKILQRVKVTENTNAASKFGLTQREKDILDELVRGAKNKEIAAKYDITTHTVNMHLRNVYIKMQVNSRSEAISKALKS